MLHVAQTVVYLAVAAFVLVRLAKLFMKTELIIDSGLSFFMNVDRNYKIYIGILITLLFY